MKLGNRTENKTILGLLLFPLIIASASLATNDLSVSELAEQSQACLDCHEDYERTLINTPHQLSRTGDLHSPIGVGCISCHDGWAAHLEDPSADNIAVFSDSLAAVQQAACGRCHQTSHQASMTTTDAHGLVGLTCSSCHTIHADSGADRRLTLSCRDCHLSVMANFNLYSAHPVASGEMQCTDCHKLTGVNDPLLQAGLDWRCQSCHTELAGPYVYEHEVVYDHLVDGGGCTTCHNPHGSPNDRLLRQPGQALCMQCHGMPPGHAGAHSGFVAGTDCMVCHSQVHGSNDNRLLMNPDLNLLFSSNCYQSGCHRQP
jgi:DmsE family decaheme c-type cytochrome